MKILQINSVCNFGSTGRIVVEISDYLKKYGDTCNIAYGQLSSNIVGSFKFTFNIENHIHNVLARLFCNQGEWSYFGTYRLLKYIDSVKPDIIHLHNLHGNYVNISMLFSYLQKKQIPVVFTMHDCWSFTGKCFHFENVNCYNWISGCNNCVLLHEPPFTLLDRTNKQWQSKKYLFQNLPNLYIVCVSNWLKKHVTNSLLRFNELHVIHNGIDLEVFKPSINKPVIDGIPNNKYIILGLASFFTKDKGLDDFVKLSKLIDDDMIIVLVGLSKDQLKDLPSNILGFERVNTQEELINFYNIANVFINPTYVDSFPSTNLEAISCGVPVITYDTGGCSESIYPNAGAVVDKGSIIGIVNAIQNLKCESKEFYQKRCRQVAIEFFNKEKAYSYYRELYFRIINHNGSNDVV